MNMQPWQTSLAYAPLQPAFTRWVEGEGHDMAAWVDPEQQVPALDLCVGFGIQAQGQCMLGSALCVSTARR